MSYTIKFINKTAILLSFFLCFQVVASTRPLSIAISSSPNNLNPLFSTDANSQNIGRLIHISLLDFDEKMQPNCNLCETYEENLVNGQHHITFNLKKNVKFSDGEFLKANHVKEAVGYFTSTDPFFKSIFRFAFGKIKDVIVHNEYKVTLAYEKFAVDNVPNLVLLKIFKLKNKEGDKLSLEQIIGAGEYKLASTEPMKILLKSNIEGRPDILFKVVKDETTLALKLINKEIDLSLADVSPRKYQWLKENGKDLKYYVQDSTIYRYINVNHKRTFFSNQKVRQALSLLIPRHELLNFKLKGNAQLSSGVLSPAFIGQRIETQADRFDLKKAEKLLDEAGFKRNKEGIRETIEWKVSNNKASIELVNVFKHYYKKAGIEVNIVTQEWGTFMKSIKTGNFDIYMSQWIGFTGPEIFNHIFSSKSLPPRGGNRGYYVDKELDAVLDQAINEFDREKRTNLYLKAQKLMEGRYAYIDLWHPKILWIGQKCVENLNVYPNASFLPLSSIKESCTHE